MCGQRRADVQHTVALALVRDLLDEIGNDLANARFQVLDPVRGEGLLGQPPEPRMRGRVDRKVANKSSALAVDDRRQFLDMAVGVAVLIAVFEREGRGIAQHLLRSEEHTSELQSLMRISYAVFCLKKKKK